MKKETELVLVNLISVTFFFFHSSFIICIILASIQVHIGFLFVYKLSDSYGIAVMYAADIL